MRSRERRTTHTLIAALAGLSLVAAACGSDTDDADEASSDAPTSEVVEEEAMEEEAMEEETMEEEAPATDAMEEEAPTTDAMEEDAMQEEVMEADAGLPERIVSLSPTHTEIMFAIGAGDMLVAVDQFSNYPEAALELPNELSGFEPDVEAIAAYEPDLVLISGDFTGLGDQLSELGIASWDGPAATNFGETYAQIEQLGAATGQIGDAAELVLSMQTSIEEIAAAAPQPEVPLTYFHELDPSLFSSTSSTFIGEVYGIFGLTNIADELEADAGQYPQLNAEFLVAASPDLVFLADTLCCGETAETFGARDGYDTIAAVQNGNVIELSDDVASRWGPRIVEFIETVGAAVAAAAVTAS